MPGPSGWGFFDGPCYLLFVYAYAIVLGMKEVIAVETLDIDTVNKTATIVDADGDVRSGHDITRDGYPMVNQHRIARMGPRRNIEAEEAGLLDGVSTSPAESPVMPEVQVEIVGPYVDLGVRATRLTRIMDNLAHASMLTGLIANREPDREDKIEKYGGTRGKKGEARIKQLIASINGREIDNMWNGIGYGQLYGPPRDDNGNLSHLFTGFNREVRDNFVGPSNHDNLDEFRTRLRPYTDRK